MTQISIQATNDSINNIDGIQHYRYSVAGQFPVEECMDDALNKYNLKCQQC